MLAGTLKASTKSTRTRKRSKVFPVAGYVNFNWRSSALGNEVFQYQSKTISLSSRDRDKLNLMQLMGNRRGFIVALVCPRDGTVVETWRGSDLPDGVLARCPMPDCGKEWLDAE
jgi:hypothetical protein